MANIPLQSITFPGLSDKYTTPTVDTTLTQAGAAADAKKTGDELAGLKNDFAQLEDKVEDAYNAYVVETETGSIASFTDGADDVPVKDLSVAIEPVQDLHGQSSPYPAGGGVNKLDLHSATGNNVYGLAVTKDETTGVVTISGTYSSDNANVSFAFLMNVPYIADTSPVAIDINASLQEHLLYPSAPIRWGDTTNGNIAIDLKNLVAGTSYTFTFKPMICANSLTPTAYAPYSNICPISGWTGAKVYYGGKNMLVLFEDGKVPSVSNGALVDAPGARSDYIPIKPSTSYALSVVADSVLTDYIFYYDENKNFIRYANGTGVIIEVSPNNAKYVMIRVSIDAISAVTQAQFEEGNVVTDYNPTSTLPVNWTTEAGTVYGGTLDVTTGVLTVDRVYEEYDLSSISYTTINGYDNWVLSLSAVSTLPTLASGKISNIAKYIYSGSAANADHFYLGENTGIALYLTEGTARDKTASFVYPLATPQTYQLTPQEVNTVLGQNNIFADCGNVTVQYRADTKLYIDKVISA